MNEGPGAVRRRPSPCSHSFVAIGFRAHVAHALQGLAAVRAKTGEHAEAARLLGRAAAALDDVGAAPEDFDTALPGEAEAQARAHLGEAAFTAAFKAGRAEPIDT